jgi:hypothetical protein
VDDGLKRSLSPFGLGRESSFLACAGECLEDGACELSFEAADCFSSAFALLRLRSHGSDDSRAEAEMRGARTRYPVVLLQMIGAVVCAVAAVVYL